MLALAAACNTTGRLDQPVSQPKPSSMASPSPARGASPEFGKSAAEELSNLKDGISLAEWTRAHPNDEITVYSHELYDACNKQWAARATKRERLKDGREVVRHAYFYPRVPNAFSELPVGVKSDAMLRRESFLGSIWVERLEPEPGIGQETAALATEEISKQFGSADRTNKIWYCNASSWMATAKWKKGNASIASAFEKRVSNPEKSRVLAFGFLPISEIRTELGGPDPYVEKHDRELALLARAVKMAGLGDQSGSRLIAVAQIPEEKDADFRLLSLVSAVKPWLIEGRKLDSTRYAAALLAADVTLDISRSTYLLEDKKKRRRRRQLEALGARFTDTHLDSTVYLHSWLRQSIRLDPEGPAGDLALVRLMEFGFARSAACADGSEYFRRVIKEGEKYLARATDLELRTAVEFMVGDAYGDIVALAAGVEPLYGGVMKYEPEAPRARVKAIRHYRAALASASPSREAGAAWRNAWRLQAGLPPVRLRFYCIYD